MILQFALKGCTEKLDHDIPPAGGGTNAKIYLNSGRLPRYGQTSVINDRRTFTPLRCCACGSTLFGRRTAFTQG